METQKKHEAIAYQNCISTAYHYYLINWAKACKTHTDSINANTKNNPTKLKACKQLSLDNAYFYASPSVSWEELQKNGDAQCEREYKQQILSYKNDCALPTHAAKYVNSMLKEDEDSCVISSKMEGRL